MRRVNRPSDPELEALLESGRIIRSVPTAVRARALARARATVSAAATPIFAAIPEAPARGRGLRIALAAAVALALAAAGAAASYLIRAPHRPKPPSLIAPPGIAPVRISVPATPSVPTATQAPISVAKLKATLQSATGRESYAAELRLLQRAQAAYAERDLARALALAAEHSRRFPNGRLAEEREALRVRSLAASGRGADARRAVAAFARRFPHSVLLPRLQQSSATAE